MQPANQRTPGLKFILMLLQQGGNWGDAPPPHHLALEKLDDHNIVHRFFFSIFEFKPPLSFLARLLAIDRRSTRVKHFAIEILVGFFLGGGGPSVASQEGPHSPNSV